MTVIRKEGCKSSNDRFGFIEGVAGYVKKKRQPRCRARGGKQSGSNNLTRKGKHGRSNDRLGFMGMPVVLNDVSRCNDGKVPVWS